MADNKPKACPKRLIQILAFSMIASFALIITGIVFSTFPKESVHNETTSWHLDIDYEVCLPLNLRYKTCEDYFTDPNAQTGSPYCQCLVDFTTTTTVPGNNIHVYCQLDLYNLTQHNTNSSTSILMEITANKSEQCDPYTFEEPSANEVCEAIPDIIFNDELKLQKINETSGDYDIDLGRFKKSVRWNSVDDSNKIIISMVSNWTTGDEGNNTITPGRYRLMVIKYTQNKNIYARKIIFSSQRTVSKVVQRSNVFDIVSLALGVLLLFASIVAIALRKCILGAEVKNETMIPVSTNTRQSKPLPEENPLSPDNA